VAFDQAPISGPDSFGRSRRAPRSGSNRAATSGRPRG